MKRNIIHETQCVLDLIAKRDLDDDGKIRFSSNERNNRIHLYRKEEINR